MRLIHPICGLLLLATVACAKPRATAAPAPVSAPASAQATPGDTTSAIAPLEGAGLVASDPRHAGTADVVRAGVRAHLPEMRGCYKALLATQPTLAGTVVASFDIAPDGTVTAASAVGVAPEVEACVAGTIKQIKFAVATDGAVHIKAYPIEFKP